MPDTTSLEAMAERQLRRAEEDLSTAEDNLERAQAALLEAAELYGRLAGATQPR